MESTTRLPPAPIRPVMDLGSCIALLIVHCGEADDLECARSRWNFHFDGVAFPFIQRATTFRRLRRNETCRDIGVFTRYQLVSDLLVLVNIEKDDFRTERYPVPGDLIKVDQ